MLNKLFVVALLLCLPAPALSQGVITTIAGTEWLFPLDVQRALDAPLGGGLWLGVAVDAQGNFYIADTDNFLVEKVTPQGDFSIVAGNGINGFSGDGGSARNASLFLPNAVAVDGAGNIYISEFGNRIRKVTTDGVIRTIAGTGKSGYSGDNGPALTATFNRPYGIAVDQAGNVYVADNGNNVVRKISVDGMITTYAGGGTSADGLPGPATRAAFASPYGLAVDAKNVLYIADSQNFSVRAVGTDGTIRTVAGGGSSGGDGGPATSSFLYPVAVAVDGAGNLFIADLFGSRIAKVGSDGIISTVAGNGQKTFPAENVLATQTSVAFGTGVAVGNGGEIYIADRDISRIRKVTTDGLVNTVAGNGRFRTSPDGTIATSAAFYLPTSLAVDAKGNTFIAEPSKNRVRRLSPDGTITNFAGGAKAGASDDGVAAAQAELGYPAGVAVDTLGNVYISDADNSRIRKVGADGLITTFAGGPAGSGRGDGGPAMAAELNDPRLLAFDKAGNLYFSNGDHTVRKISGDGIITTVAGNGKQGFAGDNGPALSAMLNDPYGVAVDADGNLYIGDYGNNRIRKVNSSGIISTYAGTGVRGFSGDGGPAIQAKLAHPDGITIGPDGALYVADETNDAIRRIDTNGTITTVAGTGLAGFSGDGNLATLAQLSVPSAVVFNASGDLLIADYVNNRVRAVLAGTTTFDAAPFQMSFTAKADGQTPPTQTLGLTGSVTGVAFALTAAQPWLKTSTAAGSMPASVQVSIDPAGLAPGSYTSDLTVAASQTVPRARTLQVSLTVLPADPPKLASSPAALSFNFVEGAAARTATIKISNEGGGSIAFSGEALSGIGPGLLVVSPGDGVVSPNNTASLRVTADPAGRIAGTYTGRITVTSTGSVNTLQIPVTITINPKRQVISLSQTGLTFMAVAGGASVPRQTVEVRNGGAGAMSFTAVVSGNTNWLSVNPSAGTAGSDPSTGVQLEVTANPSSLAPGEYYGQVQIRAAADNSPQTILVVLRVLPAGSNPGPIVQPTGLIFTGVAGAGSPGSQNLFLSNLTPSTINYTSGRLTVDGTDWFVQVPPSAAVEPNRDQQIVVQPDTSKLGPGVYRGTLTLLFGGGITRTVNLALIVTSGDATAKQVSTVQGPCIPSKLVPLFTSLGDHFDSAVGWPTQINSTILDDCGIPMTSGDVIVSFSNGDPAMALTYSAAGNWGGTWQARKSGSSQVTLSLKAENAAAKIKGAAEVTGGLRLTQTAPVIESGAVVSPATMLRQAPQAPGSLVTILGSHLADTTAASAGLPLSDELNGTSVLMAGRILPLIGVSNERIDAVIPFDMPVNTSQQLIVQRGDSISLPEAVTMAPAQPAVFLRDKSGSSQGMIYVVSADGSTSFAETSAPARPGDTLSIRCSGLGAVSPAATAGTAAPASPPALVTGALKVRIGNLDAPIKSAALVAGTTGMYEVLVRVPDDAPSDPQAPVVLDMAGQTSAPVTLPIQGKDQ